MEILFSPQAFDDFMLFIMGTRSIGLQGFRKMLLLFDSFKYEEKLSLEQDFDEITEIPDYSIG